MLLAIYTKVDNPGNIRVFIDDIPTDVKSDQLKKYETYIIPGPTIRNNNEPFSFNIVVQKPTTKYAKERGVARTINTRNDLFSCQVTEKTLEKQNSNSK